MNPGWLCQVFKLLRILFLVSLPGIMLLFCSLPASAERDPLFGDLPATLRRVDLAISPDITISEEIFGSLIRAVQNRIASESSISGISPGGFEFEIGPLGLPRKTSSNLGTIWTNGAQPVGEGRLSIGASYTYLRFKTFDGRSLNRFLDLSEWRGRQVIPPLDIDLELTTQILGLSALYGVTEDWEVGLFTPIVMHESRGDIHRGTQWVGSANGRTEGLGDMMLLTKYRLAHGDDWTWSVGARLKLPTGDDDKYLGTGKTDKRIQMLLTRRFGNLETNLDVGYTWNGFGSDYNALHYRAGLAYGITDRMTLVAELIGSHSDVSIFDTLDAGLGVKFNPTGGLVIQAGMRIPLDDDGLRPEVVPSFGLEWRF